MTEPTKKTGAMLSPDLAAIRKITRILDTLSESHRNLAWAYVSQAERARLNDQMKANMTAPRAGVAVQPQSEIVANGRAVESSGEVAAAGAL